jgi:hypothetical protein
MTMIEENAGNRDDKDYGPPLMMVFPSGSSLDAIKEKMKGAPFDRNPVLLVGGDVFLYQLVNGKWESLYRPPENQVLQTITSRPLSMSDSGKITA